MAPDTQPDPNNNALKLEVDTQARDEVLRKRKACIPNKVDLFFREDPILVSRASMQYIYDEAGRRYLDCVSNVQHVGHCHPNVVSQVAQQMTIANCNIRFLSPRLSEAAEGILRTLPPAFDTVLFVNSGSEANDLALRLARDFTGHEDVICVDHAYHGHLISTMQISPYKFKHGSSIEKPESVHVAYAPDVYRGHLRLADKDMSDVKKIEEIKEQYAETVDQLIRNEITGKNRTLACFISEALQSCGGQVIPPRGYMTRVAEHVRRNGGVMITDEVQTGFGRVGKSFWAFQLQDADYIPDIITMGKPMGNGFPVSAVVTRKEIANKLGGQVGYFNTFGGNPVSCAAVSAVLETIEKEDLLNHSMKMGELFEKELNLLKDKYPSVIGDVRGAGMFWGLDLISDRQTRAPATQLAHDLCLTLRRDYGVILNADGPLTNILKFKPPLCFNADDLRYCCECISSALNKLNL